MTNFEKVKADVQAMSVDEMMKYIRATCDTCAYKNKDCSDISCEDGYREWLELEV